MIDIKKILKISLLLSIFAFVQVSLYGQQSIEGKNPKQLLKYAKTAENVGDTYMAIVCYEKYLEKNPKDLKVLYMLAHKYSLSRDYKKASITYKQVFDEDPENFAKAQYYYALMLIADYKYDEALKNFNEFKKGYFKDELKNDDNLRKFLKINILTCENAQSLKDSLLDVAIVHLDTTINKAHIEAAPISISDNSLLFSSYRANSVVYYSSTDSTKKPDKRRFYLANKTQSGWESEVFKGPFNSDEQHTTNGTFSIDGKRFYFNRCFPNWQKKLICDLYVSYKNNEEWTNPEKLDVLNDPNYTTTEPTLGTYSKNNAEIIYFVSDRPGGKGGMDIWYSLFDEKNNTFKEPVNLGGRINTVADEVTPYYNTEIKTLFFSSNGHQGLGNLDVFKVNGELKKWMIPENVGYPINSSVDDIYYTLKSNLEEGYFTSNRSGGISLQNETCCDDIYFFSFRKKQYLSVTGELYASKGNPLNTFIEDKIGSSYDSLRNIAGTNISLFMIDQETGEDVFIKTDVVSESGNYNFSVLRDKDYRLVIETLEDPNKSFDFTTKDKSYNDSVVEIEPIGINVINNPFKLKIYYEFDKANIQAESKIEIDTTLLVIMNELPKIILEIGSHTDNKGDDEFNQKLSQRRAENVVQYLIQHGIDKNRLTARGYGEKQPIAPNTNPDGSDNPEGRQQNRRTEFTIIGSIDDYKRKVNNE